MFKKCECKDIILIILVLSFLIIVGGNNNIVLGTTAFIVFLYTLYAYKLFQETEKQTELSHTPFVVFEEIFPEEKLRLSKDFVFNNIGSGITINMETTLKRTLESENETFDEFEYSIEKLDYLYPDKIRRLRYLISFHVDFTVNPEYAKRDVIERTLLQAIINLQTNNKLEFIITYKNLIGEDYKTRVYTKNGKIENEFLGKIE